MNKNRWVKVTGVLLSLCLLFGVMSITAGATSTLFGVELTNVHYPEEGEEPDYYVYSANEDDYTVNNVVWFNHETGCDMEPGEVFEAGISYRIQIYISAQNDCVFAEDLYGHPVLSGVSFNGEDVTSDVQSYFVSSEDKTYIYLQYDFDSFESKLIEEVAVEGIEEPVPGETPCYSSATVSDIAYDIHEAGVEWFYKYAEDDYRYVPDGEAFVEGKEYMVKIWLECLDEYRFDLDNITATVNGDLAEVNPASAEKVIAVDYYFGECTVPVEDEETTEAPTTTKAEETTQAEETTKAPVKPSETSTAPTTAAPTTTAKPAETTAKVEEKPKAKKPAKVKIKTAKSLKKKTIVITWAKTNNADGYQVAYSTSKKFTKKVTKTKLIKKVKTVKTTIKKLKSGKKYFVKVRAYKTVEGKKLYGNYSKVKTVKVK